MDAQTEVLPLRSITFDDDRHPFATQSLWNITKIIDWCNWRENKTKYYHKRDSNKQPLTVPLYVRYSNEGINVRENRRGNQELTIQKHWYVRYSNEGIHVRENRRGNQELTIQKHWQHGVHKTQNEDKQSGKLNTESLKNEQQGPRQIPGVLTNGKQFLLLIRHPLFYSYIQSSQGKSLGSDRGKTTST